MINIVNTYWEISKHSSLAYKIGQLITFGILLMIYISNMMMIDFDANDTARTLLRGAIEGIIFFLLTHFILRSYLKLSFVNQPLSAKRSLSLFVVLFLIAISNVIISFQIGDIAYFAKTQPNEISFSVDDKEILLSLHDPKLWLIVISNQMLFLGCWALFYIVWHVFAGRRELQRQMQEARIQQLTNQLSPHFLFNTFNSIRALIFEDQQKAADIVTQLSEIFRTHLHAHLKSASILKEEWQITERYLSIEKVRLEERLTLDVEIDERLWQQPLPTLCVLTLLENAVKHGVSPNPKPGFIKVHAHLMADEQSWQLTISNSISDMPPTEGTKTGLKNTQARLHLMFGNRVTMRTVRDNDKYCVLMEMPYDKNANS